MNLPKRLSDALLRVDDESRFHATWEKTRRRMHTLRARRRRAPWVAAIVAGIAILAVFPRFSVHDSEMSPATPGVLRAVSPGPLALEEGRPPIAVEAVAEPRVLALSDRSRVELATGARVVPLVNDDSRFELALERGRARFDVTPGGPRAWTIDCGAVQVHVVGTSFVIERATDHVHVEVERGRVRVEGERVPSGSRVLGRGEFITVSLANPAPEPAEVDVVPQRALPEVARPARAGSLSVEPVWRTMAERGPHDDAYAVLDAEGGVHETVDESSPRELMLLADVARLSGHPVDAVSPLERLLESHADAPEAPLAAIILARLELAALHRPERAIRAFERAVELGVPAAFDAEVCAGLAIARSRAGDEDGAATLAGECLLRHASPPHAAELRALSLASE